MWVVSKQASRLKDMEKDRKYHRLRVHTTTLPGQCKKLQRRKGRTGAETRAKTRIERRDRDAIAGTRSTIERGEFDMSAINLRMMVRL